MSKQSGSSRTAQRGASRHAAAELELSSDADAAADLDDGWDEASGNLGGHDAVHPPLEDFGPESSEEIGFFDHGADNTVPPIAADAVEEMPRLPPSRALSERRAQIRKVVALVVSGASLLAAFVVVKLLWSTGTARAHTDPALNSLGTVIPSLDMNAKPLPVLGNELVAAKQDPPPSPAAQEQVAEEVRIEVFDKADDAPAAEPAPAPAAVPAARPAAPPPAAARSATKLDARRLLASGKLQDAVTAARSALAADPTDAETYILLGAALQDTGRWEESMVVFGSCVQNAKRGPLDDCRALARR